MNNPILDCCDLHKSYKQGDGSLEILTGVNLEVKPGETISIMGSSGSGKSTLLHLLAGLDVPTSGTIIVDGHDLTQLSDNQICQIRNKNLGFIYQFHHLLPEFTALENILMPLLIRGNITPNERKDAVNILSLMNLKDRVNHFPGQLSGGERQRVAIARAVINNPKLIFADEPTGNLDNHTSNQVLEIFFQLQKELETSLIMVTHDLEIASKTKYQYRLHEGKLTHITKSS